MWKAEKIELKKNEYNKNSYYFEDCYTLKINEEWITNTIANPMVFPSPNLFQSCVCDFCGVEGCNPGGMLMVRRHNDALLFLPAFEWMEDFEEYDSSDSNGDVECPPHKWFTHGILKVEGEQLMKLFELVPGLAKDNIPEITEGEMENLLKWESLVRDKPKGFIHDSNLKDDE